MNKNFWKRFLTWNPHHNDGFTLVELIVVIAILAILAAVAVPAYSGYIEKANRTGDEQLLAAVNKAFASACAINGDDIYLVEDVRNITLVDGKIPDNAVSPYGTEFWQFYGENKDTAFKVIGYLKFVNGMFIDGGKGATISLPGGGTLTLSAEQLDLLINSTYAEDIGGLMNQVDGVAGLVSGLLLGNMDESQAAQILGDYMTSDDYLIGAIEAMGGTYNPDGGSASDQYGAVLAEFRKNQALQKLAADLDVDVKDLDPNTMDNATLEKYNEVLLGVEAEVDKNLLIMSVAQSASTQSADDILKVINSTDPKTQLIGMMSGANSGGGMGQAALVYGAFTAYAMSDDATDVAKQALAESSKEGGDPTAVFDVLTGDELAAFQAYMNKAEGQNDLNACIEAMGVINSTANNKDAMSGMLANGFNNNDFVGALNDLLGNS